MFSSYCLLPLHAGDNLVSTEIFLCSNKFIEKRKSKDKVLQREIQYTVIYFCPTFGLLLHVKMCFKFPPP